MNVPEISSYYQLLRVGLEYILKQTASKVKPKRGRPKTASNLARPHRLVTFVTARERALLEQVALEEERSMAAVLHRIIKAHFAET